MEEQSFKTRNLSLKKIASGFLRFKESNFPEIYIKINHFHFLKGIQRLGMSQYLYVTFIAK